MPTPDGILANHMSQASHLPLLPDGTLPPCMLLLRWLARVREEGVRCVTLSRLPPGNGCIPDLLALAGITQLELSVRTLEKPFRWEGCGSSRVAVNGADATSALHHGHLPATPGGSGDASPLLALLDLARLEDAGGVHDPEASGAAWEYILSAVGMASSPRILPLASRGTGPGTAPTRQGAWNPLPFARRATVVLPMPSGIAPWAVEDERGQRHPVQVVEGPLGRELLAMLPFGALEGLRLEPLHDPVPGCNWEVSRTVLDNGHVRAELDPLGQVVRLCCDGHFIDLAGPAFQPLCDGLPLSGGAQLTVLEDGPVRARIDIGRSAPQGNLHLTYTLHAHDDVLRVAASWQGDGELVLDIPTGFRSETLRVAGDGTPWQVAQAASVVDQIGEPQAGVSWAILGDDHSGKGVMIANARPLSVSAQAGHLCVHIHPGTLFAVGSSQRSSDGLPPGCVARSLAVPARSFATHRNQPTALRLDGHLVPGWIRRPDGWSGEVLLTEPEGARGETTLYLPPGSHQAWRVDAGGVPLVQLPATPEGDGFAIEHGAYDILLVRWR
jgi:hypothetical protein